MMTKPNPLPSELNYVPANSVAYKVKKNDSFYTLAEKPEIKALGLKPIDLCYFNFKTKKQTEINWYLFNKVGCRNKTYDQMNFTFGDYDQPGVIYLPRPGAPPIKEATEPETPKSYTKMWLGIAAKYSLQLAVPGLDMFAGWVVSMDYNRKAMWIKGKVGRAGLGIGGGIGSSIIIITGVSEPDEIANYSHRDWDWNFSLGVAWGTFVETSTKAGKFLPLLNTISAVKAFTPEALRRWIITDPDGYAGLVKAALAFKENNGLKTGGKPTVYVIDTPVSAGMEVSVFYAETSISSVQSDLLENIAQ